VAEGPRRVVITGVRIVCSPGNDVESAWRRLIAGESGVANVARSLPVGVAMADSFGFGGHDVSLIFRRFVDEAAG